MMRRLSTHAREDVSFRHDRGSTRDTDCTCRSVIPLPPNIPTGRFIGIKGRNLRDLQSKDVLVHVNDSEVREPQRSD